ncbi:hypothetical protein G5B40_09975 [Pikeienuella piscinae]|uniref:Rap1a immunity protein domain-containing protein n=1 Tax=Pikeienuella piscinae TaxID=2748098 RepID=A0A7L5BY28_9RHOB|nr:Rap1a/Tai family immunity protein [Pikeienuella piscinae]QIE55748.1 hypothetical protein G5B40_09975 [Pikeienuella piscinae]
MKRTMPVAAVALLLSAGAVSAVEQDNFMVSTGADLAALCAVTPSHADYAASIHMCEGYIVGVNQFHEAWMRAKGGTGIYCLADADAGAPTRDEVASNFAAWVAGDDDAAAAPAVEALMRWAAFTYPCK